MERAKSGLWRRPNRIAHSEYRISYMGSSPDRQSMHGGELTLESICVYHTMIETKTIIIVLSILIEIFSVRSPITMIAKSTISNTDSKGVTCLNLEALDVS